MRAGVPGAATAVAVFATARATSRWRAVCRRRVEGDPSATFVAVALTERERRHRKRLCSARVWSGVAARRAHAQVPQRGTPPRRAASLFLSECDLRDYRAVTRDANGAVHPRCLSDKAGSSGPLRTVLASSAVPAVPAALWSWLLFLPLVLPGGPAGIEPLRIRPRGEASSCAGTPRCLRCSPGRWRPRTSYRSRSC